MCCHHHSKQLVPFSGNSEDSTRTQQVRARGACRRLNTDPTSWPFVRFEWPWYARARLGRIVAASAATRPRERRVHYGAQVDRSRYSSAWYVACAQSDRLSAGHERAGKGREAKSGVRSDAPFLPYYRHLSTFMGYPRICPFKLACCRVLPRR